MRQGADRGEEHVLVVGALDEKKDLVFLDGYLVGGLGVVVVRGVEDGEVGFGIWGHHGGLEQE